MNCSIDLIFILSSSSVSDGRLEGHKSRDEMITLITIITIVDPSEKRVGACPRRQDKLNKQTNKQTNKQQRNKNNNSNNDNNNNKKGDQSKAKGRYGRFGFKMFFDFSFVLSSSISVTDV